VILALVEENCRSIKHIINHRSIIYNIYHFLIKFNEPWNWIERCASMGSPSLMAHFGTNRIRLHRSNDSNRDDCPDESDPIDRFESRLESIDGCNRITIRNSGSRFSIPTANGGIEECACHRSIDGLVFHVIDG